MRCLLVALLFAPLTAAALDDDVQFIGAGVYNHPKFDGSPAQHKDPIPQVHYVNRSWFVRTTEGILEGGLRWGVGQSAAAGVQLAYEDGPRGEHAGRFVRRACRARWQSRPGARSRPYSACGNS